MFPMMPLSNSQRAGLNLLLSIKRRCNSAGLPPAIWKMQRVFELNMRSRAWTKTSIFLGMEMPWGGLSEELCVLSARSLSQQKSNEQHRAGLQDSWG